MGNVGMMAVKKGMINYALYEELDSENMDRTREQLTGLPYYFTEAQIRELLESFGPLRGFDLAQLQVAWQRQLFQTGGGLGGGNGGGIATKVVCLTEVVTADELKDDEEYEDILEDMRVEGGKFGTLMNIVIPRPQPNGEPSLGLGKVSFSVRLSLRTTTLHV
ncbi:splicing factor U2af large subunit B-like [Papaver somniferum]|uniref:splicing factor U2af large subunit B-like n=1 Tax=Papaver somniferum TaxID=3469 RepID=UPI000E6F8B89|nr:splicing factor U2af large subunit B-like [Papaver somniferum]